jgi:thiamine-monophosphate kinase
MVAHLKHRYRRPQPRLALAGALREHASAAMDLSDGLAKDLARLCRASGCGAHVQMADLPLSASAATTVAADRSQYQAVLAGGDDYEILASVPPQREAAFRGAAAAADIEVTRIGSLTLGSGISIEADDGHRFELARSGWDHFAKRPPGPDRG